MLKSKFSASDEVQELSPYVGAAGEHYVMSELLLRQFDAALVAVDSGVDILAEKNEKLLRVQVKTRRLGANNRSSFVLTEKSLGRAKLPDFYVIVLVDFASWKLEPFIFPRAVIQKMIDDQLIVRRQKQKFYRGELIRKDGKWFIRNLNHDISKYHNAFELIKA